MPTTAVASSGATKTTAPRAKIPFIRSSYEHVEPLWDTTVTLTGATQSLGPFDVSAYGYMRHIMVQVETSTAATGAVTQGPDYPFQVIKEVTLIDVNSAPIVGPLSGFDLALVNAFGGYVGFTDPRFATEYASGTLQLQFMLRIPVEANGWDGYCSLANQNAQTTYKVRLTVAATSDTALYTSAPATTQMAVRIRGWLEAWAQPLPVDADGNPQETTPPGDGSTQFWSKTTFTAINGNVTNKLNRAGNIYRTFLLINRSNATGLRLIGGNVTSVAALTPVATTTFPAQLEFRFDSRQRLVIDRSILDKYMFERTGFNKHQVVSGSAEYTAGAVALTRPSGSYDDVYMLDFTHDRTGVIGYENRNLWVPSVQASRVEFVGTWTGAANLDVLVNDIAPAGR